MFSCFSLVIMVCWLVLGWFWFSFSFSCMCLIWKWKLMMVCSFGLCLVCVVLNC